MAAITYNYKKGSNRAFPDDVISARIRVYKDKDASGKEKVWTHTVKRPPEITARTKLVNYFNDEKKKFEEECKDGLVPIKPTAGPTFVKYAAAVIEEKHERNILKESTYVRYKSMLQRLDDYFGEEKLLDVTTEELEEFYDALAQPGMNKRGSDVKGLSAKTIREHHNLISGVFKTAIHDRKANINPASTVQHSKAEKPDVVYYQHEDLEKIARVMKTQPLKWQTFFEIAITTGCRRGEILGLKQENINFVTGNCKIKSTLLVDKGVGVYESTPKTEKSARNIPLPQTGLDMIKALIAENEAQKAKVGEYWEESSYIFRQANGKPMHPDSVNGYFKKLSKKEQKKDPSFPQIKPHAFRHTAASILIAEHVDIVTVANFLGHSSPVVTEKIYAHPIAESRSQAYKFMSEYMQTLITDMPEEEK